MKTNLCQADCCSHLHLKFKSLAFFLIAIFLVACQSNPPVQTTLPCTVEVEGRIIPIEIPAGNTVQQTLEKVGVTLNILDRVEPPSFSLITSAQKIIVVRIRETFEVEEVTIQFSQQKVNNESLPLGQTVLVQPGANGTQQITYRRLFENDIEKTRAEVKRITLVEPKPEIIMVGVQTQFSSVSILRKLAYLTSGNAWIMQRTTTERRSLVSTGDLDGRIFSLSPDGKWLLFSRKSAKPASEEINSLWIVNTSEDNPKPLDLKIKNVVHFAEWSPSATYAIYYSTVEPRVAEPGWQANNDLQVLSLTPAGLPGKKDEILASNSGGIYGWWGTSYFISTDGKQIAYARPDSLGLVNLEKKSLNQLIGLLPFITRANSVWVPGVSWSPDGKILYFVNHMVQSGAVSDETSPRFDLTAIFLTSKIQTTLLEKSGLYSFPITSPLTVQRYSIAFLKAIFANQSDTSRYHLVMMDRDGSNQHVIFPSEGAIGIDPQKIVWGAVASENSPRRVALLYQGNIWLINPDNFQSQQITGDYLIHRIDWK